MYANGEGVTRSGAAAANWFYKAGKSYLKFGNKSANKYGYKDRALLCVERIKELPKLGLTVPNIFLADKLLAAIYNHGSQAKSILPGKATNASLGTGWPVEGGFVVTNHHVVAGHKEIIILRRNGVKISGSVVMDDRINDLVLIEVENVHQLPPALPLAQKPVRVGAKVFTVGYTNPTLMGSEVLF